MLYLPEAQGSLPRGQAQDDWTYAVHVQASAVPYVPCTVAPQVLALALDKGARREMLAAWCAMLAR